MLTQPRSFLASQLNVLVDEEGLLDGVTVHLFKNNVTIDIDTVKADLDECNFTGYAASTAVVWGAPYNLINGKAVQGDRKQFTASADLEEEQTAYGYYLMSGDDPPVYLGAERFNAPVVFSASGDACGVVPSFSVTNRS